MLIHGGSPSNAPCYLIKSLTCTTKRRKTKSEEREVVNMAVLAHGGSGGGAKYNLSERGSNNLFQN
jgi:hypothetical protein